ncbi:alpha/beta fold hydrolase [Micromonospora sp. NPDC049275]|uniref:alpha/beta fold hydrolase n=1 Tax=Micromonospora sp. NPDC049275 TaxID=3364268 RepID=UPI0037194003
MHKITVNGALFAYDEAGTGSPVVLLHAGIADRRMWRGVVPALAARHRVIVPDLRGYGDSELPPAPFAHHDDVIGLLDALDVPRAALVGCSFGGSVAVDTALAHPDRVTTLALFDTAVSGNEWSEEANDLWDDLVGEVDPDDFVAGAAGEVRFWVVGPGRQPADVDPELLAFAQEMDQRALAAELALGAVEVEELTPPAIGRLGELKMPVLVTAGAADVPDISRLADRIAAEAPHATRLPDVPDAAHLLPLERPEAVATALLDFLS